MSTLRNYIPVDAEAPDDIDAPRPLISSQKSSRTTNASKSNRPALANAIPVQDIRWRRNLHCENQAKHRPVNLFTEELLKPIRVQEKPGESTT